MKKILSLLVILGLVVLSACSHSTSKGSSHSSYSDEVTTEENQITYEDYQKELLPKLKDIYYKLNSIRKFAYDAGSNPSLLNDPEWLEEYESLTNDFYSDIQEVKNIDPGDDADANEIQDLMLQAMDDFEFAAINLPVSARNLDVVLLRESLDRLDHGDAYFGEANEITIRHKNEQGEN